MIEIPGPLARLGYDDSELAVAEAYPLLDEMAAEAGWDDPAMDIYDDPASREPN